MKPPVLLFGGGLDSLCYALHYKEHGRPLTLLHVDYGQIAVKGEFQSALYWANQLDLTLITDKTSLVSEVSAPNALQGTGTDAVVDARNLALVLTATKYGDLIYLGITKIPEDSKAAPDTVEEFIVGVNTVLAQSFLQPKRVEAPLSNVSKESLVRKYYDNYHGYMFEKTWTCWKSNTLKECGGCSHCISKTHLWTKTLGNGRL